MKKLVLIIAAVFFFVFPIRTVAVSETDSGIFYSVANGEVTIEGFNYAGTTLDIPAEIEGYPVKYIASQACRGNEAIVELYIPSSVESIGEFAFAECKNLTKAVIKGTKTIGFSAFKGCSSLKKLTLPENCEKIDDSAFEGCIMLGELKIPMSLTSIGYDAFLGCHKLRFDVKNNEYAKEYAKNNSIPTSFFETWEFTVTLLVISCVAAAFCYLSVKKMMTKRRKES